MIKKVLRYPIVLCVVLLAGCAAERPVDRQALHQIQANRQPANQQQTNQQQADHVSGTRLLLDTYCTITVFGSNEQSLLDEAFDLCSRYEALFSITVEGSDVWRINHAGGMPVAVDQETLALIGDMRKFGDITGGKFDISIGRLSTLWDFTGQSGIPSETDIVFARNTVNYENILIDGNTVQLVDPEAWIDLGGVAKGYIADRIAAFLMERGVTGAVIDLGGDVALAGNKPDGTLWRIGIRRPFGGISDLLGVVETGAASIVTSGTYERQFESDGVIYHHILDPDTGMPVETDIVSVTIISDSAAAGDALSTSVLLIGSDMAADLLNRVPGFIGALIVLENGDLLEYGDIVFQVFD